MRSKKNRFVKGQRNSNMQLPEIKDCRPESSNPHLRVRYVCYSSGAKNITDAAFPLILRAVNTNEDGGN